MKTLLCPLLGSFGLFYTTLVSYGAISMTYDSGASSPGSNSYVYTGTDSLGSPFLLNMSVSGWDDSTGMTTTPTYSPTTGGGIFRGTLDTDIDPGDYVCFHFDLTDPSGNPLALGVHDPGQPYYDPAQTVNRWLANSLRYFGTDAQDTEDYAFIYSPDGGNLIHNPANGTIVVGTDQQAGAFASGSTTMSGVSIPDTASSTYAGIEALTGIGNNSYIDFNLIGGGTPITVALAGDGPGSGPMPSATRMGGYTWHFGNTGVNTFDSAAEFGFTLDGVVDPEIVVGIPEPSRAVLLGLGALALLARRKR